MNELYKKNIEAVNVVSENMSKWITEAREENWVTQDGNQMYVKLSGHTIPIYEDPNEPAKELKQVLDTIKLHKENVTVFVGIGLGHGIRHLLDHMEKGHHIMVIEPIPHMIRLAFQMYDFSVEIGDRSLLICPEKPEISLVFNHLEGVKVVEDWGIVIDKTARIRSEYWEGMQYAIEIMNQIQCNAGTVSSAGAKIADNDIATLPYVIRHRGVAELIEMFAGKPAICVATGPTLARNIHILKEIYDNKSAVILAVGQAARALLAYDIRPDFMCTVDFGPVNMTHYAGLCDEDMPLVTINKTYAPLLKTYKGPKFISAAVEAGFEESAHSVLKEKGTLAQGGSVIHMTFGLAFALGCNPIILIGHNLALTERSHFALADSGGKVEVDEKGQIRWKINDPRSKTLHNRDDITMGDQHYVPGYFGGEVLTNTGLMTFLTAMQSLISQYAGEVINCTEGGAHIPGSKRMFLRDAKEKYCKEPIDKSAITPLLTLADDSDKLVERAIKLIKNDIAELDNIITQSNRGLRTVEKMRIERDPYILRRLLEVNGRVSDKAQKSAKKLHTISLAIYWASRRIQSRALNVEGDIEKLILPKYRDDLMIRLDRNELILKTSRDAARNIMDTYKNTQHLLVEHWLKKSTLDPTGETEPPDLSDANQYFEAENFARPLLEARRILNAVIKWRLDNLDRCNIGSAGLPLLLCPYDDSVIEQAREVERRALAMRDEKIKEAIAMQEQDYKDNMHLMAQYLDLIDDSRKIGREAHDKYVKSDQDQAAITERNTEFERALKLMQAAIDMLPEREEARWGMASALYFSDRIQESADYYYDLTVKFPENLRYKIELGQVLLKHGNIDGFKYVREAMEKTDEFAGYAGTLAQWYEEYNMPDEALGFARKHLETSPHDDEVKELVRRLEENNDAA